MEAHPTTTIMYGTTLVLSKAKRVLSKAKIFLQIPPPMAQFKKKVGPLLGMKRKKLHLVQRQCLRRIRKCPTIVNPVKTTWSRSDGTWIAISDSRLINGGKHQICRLENTI
mmetsp:Transcript_279/g.665  ORF Transcript_279/g.665 Transcript_279/m.665 type:complete len:111 (+) Transcript_279:701-1033(+)